MYTTDHRMRVRELASPEKRRTDNVNQLIEPQRYERRSRHVSHRNRVRRDPF